MAEEIRVYRLQDLIRINKTGLIDVERSKELIRQIAIAADFNRIQNVIVDLRKSTVPENLEFQHLLEVAIEFGVYLSGSGVRIAHIVPDEAQRIALAEQLRDLAGIKKQRYGVFTSFEKAIDWFAGVEE